MRDMMELYKYEKRYHYPHMKPNDIAIWERFIEAYPDAYFRVQYDVGIGDIPEFMEQTSSPQGQAMRELYRLKIDVVAESERFLDIVEVKHEAAPSSLGQLLAYVDLYKRDFAPTKAVRPVLITNVRKPNMDYLTQQQGIEFVVV